MDKRVIKPFYQVQKLWGNQGHFYLCVLIYELPLVYQVRDKRPEVQFRITIENLRTRCEGAEAAR